MGFLVRKSKQKRREFLMPDIARFTPYSLEECLDRLEQYADGEYGYEQSQLDLWQDELDFNVWYFRVQKTFRDSEAAGRGMGIGRVQIEGVLLEQAVDNVTQVKAEAQTPANAYLEWIGTIVLFGLVFLIIQRRSPTNLSYIFFCLMTAFIAYFIYQSIASIRVGKVVIVDELKQLFPKQDGSIE